MRCAGPDTTSRSNRRRAKALAISEADSVTAISVAVTVDSTHTVSALWLCPDRPRAAFVFAHGAGAGMAHSFMTAAATALFAEGIATLRYQFPYMEAGAKRPDRPELAHATVRAAVAEAARQAPSVALFAGGKSFGGRMTSQAQAASPLPGVRGLVFLGFPLHPANKPSVTRADHLAQVGVPMLFAQGTRDALADLTLLAPIVEGLAPGATLYRIDDADHSFHVRAKSGRKDADVLCALAATVAAWCAEVAPG